MTNVSLIALGINETREGAAITEGGIVHIAEGILDNWFTPLRWTYGSGDKEESGCCNLGDMFKGRHNEKGESDTRFLPAMYIALGAAFGIDGEMTPADKMAFKRGFAIAAARHAGQPITFVDAKANRKGKDIKVRAVQVPASVAFKVTEESGEVTAMGKELVERIKSNLQLEGKAIPDDATLVQRAKELPVNCIGGKHPVFGKVPSSTNISDTLRTIATDAGVMLAGKPRNGRATDSGAKFGESLDYVSKCLDMLIYSDESEFAPSEALECKMREVSERIAAYFAA